MSTPDDHAPQPPIDHSAVEPPSNPPYTPPGDVTVPQTVLQPSPPQYYSSPQYYPQQPHPPSYASAPTYPQQPYPPQVYQPPTYPASAYNQWGQPPAPMQRPLGRVRAFARPFPRWALLVGAALIALMLAFALFTGWDWADGAAQMATIAGILCVLALIILGVRLALGLASSVNPSRRSQLYASGGLIVILLGLLGTGIASQAPLHRAQARTFESQKQWQQALTEYSFAGERAPSSDDLARVHDEWGETLAAAGKQQEAIEKFSIVLDTYPKATRQAPRAQRGMTSAYLTLGDAAFTAKNYAAAAKEYDLVLASSFCDTTCHTSVAGKDATAYFKQGEASLTSQAFGDAVDTFRTLLSRFPSAPESAQVHGDFAKALLGQGAQQITSACPNAIPIYQELASSFKDTDEGQQAAAALAKPQPVRGKFTMGVPGGAHVYLTTGLRGNLSDAAYRAAIARAMRLSVHSDGTFEFSSVKQGDWDLLWSTGTNYLFTYKQDSGDPSWIAHVGPLCPFDFGSVDEKFP